ncbi:hypothetical protein EC968_003776 [Mortierella alpina]|nr:hypothetical protein EC968_003776 [Mortierella alpina]
MEQNLTRREYNHYLRFHSTTPVVVPHATLNASVKFERRPDQHMVFVCVCGKAVLGRDNFKEHYKKAGCDRIHLRTPMGISLIEQELGDEEEEAISPDQQEEMEPGPPRVIDDAAMPLSSSIAILKLIQQQREEYLREREEFLRERKEYLREREECRREREECRRELQERCRELQECCKELQEYRREQYMDLRAMREED